MSSEAQTLEALRDRLQVLEKENELLSERAEEISLLGLVAEVAVREQDPWELLTAILERVCVLKSIPYGACLVPSWRVLVPRAVYHQRRAEGGEPDRFARHTIESLSFEHSRIIGAAQLADFFETFAIASPGLVATSVALIPITCGSQPSGCLLFADDARNASALALLLPLLERVADLTQGRLDILALVDQLQRINQDLGVDVEAKTHELKRSEARYRALFDQVPDGVVLVDAGDGGRFGRIEDANEVAASMHGYSLAELKRLDIEALNAAEPGAGLESFEQRVWRLRRGQTVREEMLHSRRDGSTFPVEAIGTLVELEGRQYLLAFFRDISARRRAEEALQTAQRVESLGLLAGGIAHDFNNLLTAIMGQTGLALETLGDPTRARPHLEKALDAAGKASILTQQMLAYSGRGQFIVEPLNLNDLIKQNLSFLEASISKRVSFLLELDPNIPAVIGDVGQIQQVVMNLVINGAEAMAGSEGTLRIRTQGVHLETIEAAQWPLCGNALGAGDYLLLEIMDSGCGMSAEILARVFDPFFTTKPKGHGLGLSAVQGIIRAHHGGMAVASREGEGTTFRILLPAGIAAPARGQGEEAPGPEPIRLTVLVVDDEVYMLDVVQDTLAARGHRAVLAQSGEEALAILQAGERIDRVLLDLTMPGMGGVETFRRIRALDAGLPVILSSGYAEQEIADEFEGLERPGFLKKPYRNHELIRAVESAR